MPGKVPILLNFSAISNGASILVQGHLTYTNIKDLSFIEFGRRKTFRTLMSLYRTRAYGRKSARLEFDKGHVEVMTDADGSFLVKTSAVPSNATLQKVSLESGREAKVIDNLYYREVQLISAQCVVISDIDDTLLHSFIHSKFRMFRTLMFTSMEKRKAVKDMFDLISWFSAKGAASFYLSNSEQNLYPLIYRFLLYNKFPPGPIFLKKLRGLWEVIANIKRPLTHLHKEQILDEVMAFFPDRKFILMGDNTQNDLLIYLFAAERFPGRVSHVIIRKVVSKKQDQRILSHFQSRLKGTDTEIFYSRDFPDKLDDSFG